MELLTASVGSYPKIGDGPEAQRHRQAYSRWESGEITDEEFESIQDQVTLEVIREQVEAGLDVVTDGQIRWYDPVSHIARKLAGCEIDGLLRFFDTNFYFRQPVVVGRIERRESVLRREFEFAAAASPKPVRAVIMGPYTLARLSIDRRGAGTQALVDEFSEVVAAEVRDLVGAGARFIQIDEPAILVHPEDVNILARALERVASSSRNAEIAVHLYFEDAGKIYPRLLDLPVDCLSFDFTYGENLLDEILDAGCDKNLGLGLIDGRNTRIEEGEKVIEVVRKVVEVFEGRRLYLNPSCGLEYLPRDVAFRKLQNMVRIAERIREEIA